MFTQIDRNIERTQGGLGIGLTLVKRLVEMHHGVVSAHSEGLGKGSEFVVRLPVTEQSTSDLTKASAPSETLPTKSRTILVVDDNLDAATTLAMLLEMTGQLKFKRPMMVTRPFVWRKIIDPS